MKFQTKIFCVFAGLILLSTGSITLYSTLYHHESLIENELLKQRQVVSLLKRAVAGQYYNYLNQQIETVFQCRSELKNKAQLLSTLALQLNLDETAMQGYFKAQQRTLNRAGLDLAILDHESLVLPPGDKTILHSRSSGNYNLISTMVAGYTNQRQGYYLTLYNQDAGSNYLCYIFPVEGFARYTAAILQNIDELIRRYDLNDHLVIEQLRSTFYDDLQSDFAGAVLIADAQTNRVLLSSVPDLPFAALPAQLTGKFTGSAGEQTIEFELDGEDYFVSAGYFKPLDYRILTLRSHDEATRPALTHTLVIIAIDAGILLLSLICSVLIAKTLTLRLSEVARQARLMFSLSDDEETLLQETSALGIRPLSGTDEVSDLSNALYAMEQTLKTKVRQLISATKQKNRLQGELDAARLIQLGMLSSDQELPSSAFYQSAAFLMPAKEVGGDLYDGVLLDEDHAMFAIGDVSDKGVPAALFMSMTLSLCRAALSFNLKLDEAVGMVNRQLALHNPNMMFVTLFVLILNLKDGSFEAVNAGHCPPLLCKKDGSIQTLDFLSGPAAGALEDVSYTGFEGTLERGSTLILYTDGVSEAQNEQNEFYGTERLISLCREQKLSDKTPGQSIECILQSLNEFKGRKVQTDDITLLVLKGAA